MTDGKTTEGERNRPVSPINGQPIPNGRPKGIPNKATTRAREAIAEFIDGNVDRLTGWLDQIAEKDPKQAFDCFMSVCEYNIPKLARTEHVGDKDNPVRLQFGWDNGNKADNDPVLSAPDIPSVPPVQQA